VVRRHRAVVIHQWSRDCEGLRNRLQDHRTFVYDAGVSQYRRAPFGLKGSKDTITKAVCQVIEPVEEFTISYVDDMAVHSNTLSDQFNHIESFLHSIRQSGFTLGLGKCEFAKSSINNVGQIAGYRGIDPEKVYWTVGRLN